MKRIPLILFILMGLIVNGEAMLAGGRPNAFSEGNNAFAGVVNPANAVWIKDRFDVGAFLVHQKVSINNKDNSPLYPPGRTDLAYHAKNILSFDMAIHKTFNLAGYDSSVTIATYTVPPSVKIRTKENIPGSGTTPVRIQSKTNVLSAVFSIKFNDSHSLGFSLDYLHLSRLRNGFQNSANPVRSVSPNHVTNKGMDHSEGFGFSFGYRWNITKRLLFGAAWIRKSYAGQYRKYRGFEPHHANNYIPQTVGAGFTYRFSQKVAGRIEMIWVDQGNLPGANNSILPNGNLNTNKRGSNRSPGPGLTDATFVNAGLGCKVNSHLSLGGGLSHRLKGRFSSIFISHSYRVQTVYTLISLGAHLEYAKHELFAVCSHGLKNKVSGRLPASLGGSRFTSEKETLNFSLSYGYRY